MSYKELEQAMKDEKSKDYKKYPNLPKLPNDLEDALKKLNNKKIKNLFGEKVINSYLKLKNS